jgi:hypothetical protein
MFVGGLNQAQALSVGFSFATSDATDPSVLDATLDLTVSNIGGNDILTVKITNDSDTDGALGEGDVPIDGFTINQIFFNTTLDTSEWSGPTPSASMTFGESANGFGTFGVLLDGLSVEPLGGMGSWDIDLGVTGVDEIADFDLWSTLPPGDIQAVAALKFVQGPCDPEILDSCVEDSAFAIPGTSDGEEPPSSVPVPAAVWLFGSGLLGLVGVARRKKAA